MSLGVYMRGKRMVTESILTHLGDDPQCILNTTWKDTARRECLIVDNYRV